MKHFLFIFLAVLNIVPIYSQNLVNNPSLENFSVCPSSSSQITNSTNWSSSRNSPEYLNTCSLSNFATLPTNYFGTQDAASGNACTGMLMYGSFVNVYMPDIREFAYVTLSSPLVTGTTYYVSFKVNLADHSNYACNNMGVQFCTTYNAVSPINNTAHVYSTAVITDKNNWTTISGSFIAAAPYNALMVGNFFNDANTTSAFVGTSVPIGYNAYYFVDDLCVSANPLTCNNVLSFNWGTEQLQMDGTTATISWKAYPENISLFILEKSAGGNDFSPIVELKPEAVQTQYEVSDRVDDEPVTLYRIRALDNQGNSYLSRIMEAHYFPSGIDFLKIYPSPVTAGSEISVEYSIQSAGHQQMELIDPTGKIIRRIIFTQNEIGLHNMTFSTEKLEPGMYWLKVGNLTRSLVIE